MIFNLFKTKEQRKTKLRKEILADDEQRGILVVMDIGRVGMNREDQIKFMIEGPERRKERILRWEKYQAMDEDEKCEMYDESITFARLRDDNPPNEYVPFDNLRSTVSEK